MDGVQRGRPKRFASESNLRSFEQVEDEIFGLPPGEDLCASPPKSAEPFREADMDAQDSAHLDTLLQETVSGGLLGKR